MDIQLSFFTFHQHKEQFLLLIQVMKRLNIKEMHILSNSTHFLGGLANFRLHLLSYFFFILKNFSAHLI